MATSRRIHHFLETITRAIGVPDQEISAESQWPADMAEGYNTPYSNILKEKPLFHQLFYKIRIDTYPNKYPTEAAPLPKDEALYYLKEIKKRTIELGRLFGLELCARYATLYDLYGSDIPPEQINQEHFDACYDGFYIDAPKLPDGDIELLNWAKSIYDNMDVIEEQVIEHLRTHYEQHPILDAKNNPVKLIAPIENDFLFKRRLGELAPEEVKKEEIKSPMRNISSPTTSQKTAAGIIAMISGGQLITIGAFILANAVTGGTVGLIALGAGLILMGLKACHYLYRGISKELASSNSSKLENHPLPPQAEQPPSSVSQPPSQSSSTAKIGHSVLLSPDESKTPATPATKGTSEKVPSAENTAPISSSAPPPPPRRTSGM